MSSLSRSFILRKKRYQSARISVYIRAHSQIYIYLCNGHFSSFDKCVRIYCCLFHLLSCFEFRMVTYELFVFCASMCSLLTILFGPFCSFSMISLEQHHKSFRFSGTRVSLRSMSKGKYYKMPIEKCHHAHTKLCNCHRYHNSFNRW